MAAIAWIDLAPTPVPDPEPEIGARLAARADLACARILASVGLGRDGAPVRLAPMPVRRREAPPRQKVVDPAAKPTTRLAGAVKAKPVRVKAKPGTALAKVSNGPMAKKPAAAAPKAPRKSRAGSKAV